MAQENKNVQKHLTDNSDRSNLELTDYDVCDLYIRCIEVFVERCIALEMDTRRPFELGQVLWEKTIEARDKYREGHTHRESKR